MLRTLIIAFLGAILVVICMRFRQNDCLQSPSLTTESATKIADELPPLDDWRRTSQGWEYGSVCDCARPSPEMPKIIRLHPSVVASLVLLISLGALVASVPDERSSQAN